MVVESLHSLLLRVRLQQFTGTDEVKLRDVAQLSSAARDLAIAYKAHIDSDLKVREKIVAKLAKDIDQKRSALGLSKETTRAIKAQVLGISPGA